MSASQKQWARRIIPGGYALELAIKWPAIQGGYGSETIAPAVDNVFGMAINQHDNDGHGRQATIQWAAVLNDGVCNTPKYLGMVRFLAGHKLQFIPTNNMTGRTNPIPYDGSDYTFNKIVVDGFKDDFYNTLTNPSNGYLQIKSFAHNDVGAPVNDADLSAKIWTSWDNEWFYLYEEVTDDTVSGSAAEVWNNDCIELKIDPQPTDSVTNSIWDTRLTALGAGAGVAAWDNMDGVSDSQKQWARRIIPGGYALELAVKWSAIQKGGETITPAVNNIFGMDIHQEENDGHGRQAAIQWAAVLLNEAWETPKYLGTVKFLVDNKLQFIPTNNMTGTTNPIPYDGSAYPPTTAPIVVDGLKDSFYTTLTGPNDGYLQIRSYAHNENGAPVNDTDLSAKIWTAWDEEWFYLYEEVMDDTLSGNDPQVWAEDVIELMFDPQPTDSVTNSVWYTRLTALGTGPGVLAGDSLNVVSASQKQWARRIIPGGYALELAIKWPAIQGGYGSETIAPAVDNVFGMAINQHDNDGHGRQATIQWAAVLNDGVCNTPKYLGTVRFLAGHKLRFIPTNNMTGRTNPIPYDGSSYPPTAAPIIVDGLKDSFYTTLTGPNDGYLQIRSYAYNGNGAPVNDADLSAKIWTAWDNEWFYLYEEVMDDTLSGNATNIWEEDEIEVNFDPQPTDSVTNSVWQTRMTALGKASAGVVKADSLNGVPDSLKQWARAIIPGGYALELAIKWSAIKSGIETISPSVGNVFGMAINQHDNDGHARRQATVQWAAVLSDAVYNTPKYHGTVKFLADNKLQFIPTNNMTGATNPVPYDGSNYTPTGIENALIKVPETFSLGQNYPNPFNPQTTIEFAIPKREFVTLTIYNALGQEMTTLVNGELNAGYYKTTWNAGSEPSGVYFYRLYGGSFTETKRLVLLK